MKFTRFWLVGLFCAAATAVYVFTAKADEESDKLKKPIRELAAAIAKDPKNKSLAKMAEKIAKMEAAEIDLIMVLFKLRSKGGLGVGDKPDSVKPDGIEQAIIALDRKPPSSTALKENAKAWAQMAYDTAAITKVIYNKHGLNKKKEIETWTKYCKEMEAKAIEFAKACTAKDATPASIQKAARALNNVCLNCHNDFR
ncbi:MAG: hypothetical protein KatS3mg105_2944 [Gemmatales bacterium]|nr:MAG: hypothetical protein KatS3mg105_2944 [Gemmatales bacterium]